MTQLLTKAIAEVSKLPSLKQDEVAELVLDELARQEAEAMAAKLNLIECAKLNPPPADWFDRDEPKPF